MRRAPAPLQRAASVQVELAEQLRVTAARLQAMPAELATSLSILAGWQGLTDATVRGLALTAAAPLGFSFTVESHGDTVSVTFRRPRPYGP